MPNKSLKLDRIFWALGDPTRLLIIEHLAHGPASVSELAQPFDMALPTFMQHLGVLEDCKLIRTKKTGRVRMCSLNKKRLKQIETWLDLQQQIWQQRLQALDKFLENDNEQ